MVQSQGSFEQSIFYCRLYYRRSFCIVLLLREYRKGFVNVSVARVGNHGILCDRFHSAGQVACFLLARYGIPGKREAGTRFDLTETFGSGCKVEESTCLGEMRE